MGKSSGLVTHLTGFDSRIRIQPGCGAVAARRVRDPEDAGSIPATLTTTPRHPRRSSSNRIRATGCQPEGCGFEPRLRRSLPDPTGTIASYRVVWLDSRWV